MRQDILKEVLKIASRTYGFIHKSTPAIINDETGFLIWDYIIYNELTFLNSQTGKIISLYTSLLDEKMEKKYNEFAEKYGS